MEQPLLSVVIPTWNRIQLICAAIERALGQGDRVEVIVVDDCSTDDNLDLLTSRYGSRIKFAWVPRGMQELVAERLEELDHGPWGEKYHAIAQAWRHKWEQVIPFFAFAPAVRKIIYTTNAIVTLHSQVRKAVRTRGHFPSDKAAS